MDVPALRAENLTKRYGRLLALDALDLRVSAGEVFGWLGSNGAGKSTTIRLLMGLARPTAGRAMVFHADAADVAVAHRLLACVPADVALWPRMTGLEILDLLADIGPGVDLGYRAELVERFELVAAFASRSRVLILDEPTSGLDPLMEAQFCRPVMRARARRPGRRFSARISCPTWRRCATGSVSSC